MPLPSTYSTRSPGLTVTFFSAPVSLSFALVIQPVLLMVFATSPTVATLLPASADVSSLPSLSNTTALPVVIFAETLPVTWLTTFVAFTERLIVLVLPSVFGVILTEPSLAKFTLLPCVTASTASPFACKFQPEFNTSRTVAASFFFSSEIFNTLPSTTVVAFSM